MTGEKPRVHVIGTGGSIAGIGPDRMDFMLYTEIGDLLTIGQSLDRVPEVQDIAHVDCEDLISVPSTAIGAPEWLALSQRINQLFRDDAGLSGVAVTHGTATLEETAYFLHLTVKSERPVVVTGAMRPPTALSTDADLNLVDAVRIASTPPCRRDGCADGAQQRDTVRPGRFQGQLFPSGDVSSQRIGLSGLCRLRRAGGFLPRATAQAHHRNVLRRGRGAPNCHGWT